VINNRRLKIGILGTRGIPNRYGGFEQCAEYLAAGLVRKGHEVVVYNAHNHEYRQPGWNGVQLVHCYDPEHKIGTAGQFIYDLNCINDARKRNFDIVLQLGYTSSSVWHWRWPRRAKNIVNMDGLEWKRSKYSRKVQRFLKLAEGWAAKHGDVLIADSQGIQDYLQETYREPSVFIPYGAEIFTEPDSRVPERYNLDPYTYHLLIARMEPENNIETVIRGYLKSGSSMPLVIIGKTENAFGAYLRNTYGSRPGIRFEGGIYDAAIINNLRYYSGLYFHGHSVGGTNPSLLEAMACSALIAAHDNVFNKSILGEDAFYFSDHKDVAELIRRFADKRQHEGFLANNLGKIRRDYSWAGIVNAYEQVMLDACRDA